MFETVRNVCVFIILTSVINNLLNGSVYRKYIKVVSGLMITLVMLHPVMDVFSLGEKYICNLNNYMTKFSINNYGYEMSGFITDNNDRDIMYYSDMLKESLREFVKSKGYSLDECNFEINENVEDEHFGDILSIEFSIISDFDEGTIENIRVDEMGRTYTRDNSLMKDVASFYGIDEKNVIIR